MNKYDKRKEVPAYARLYLSEIRRLKKKSIETMALEIGVSPSYYFLIEGGYRGDKMTVMLFAKIIDILSISAEELIKAEVKYQNERSIYLENYKNKKVKKVEHE